MNQFFKAAGENPNYQLSKLDRLPKGESVILTVLTIFPTDKLLAARKKLEDKSGKEENYRPLLFLSSDEGIANSDDVSFTSFSNATIAEHGLDPADIPFWQYAVEDDKAIKATPMWSVELRFSTVDDEGNIIENGQAKYERKKEQSKLPAK